MDSSIRDVGFTRKFIQATLGGSRRFVTHLKREASEFGVGLRFMFPCERDYPEAPSQPGQSGLLCTVSDEVSWSVSTADEELLYKVFYARSTRFRETPLWLYLGDYCIVRSEELQQEEFCKLNDDVSLSFSLTPLFRCVLIGVPNHRKNGPGLGKFERARVALSYLPGSPSVIGFSVILTLVKSKLRY